MSTAYDLGDKTQNRKDYSIVVNRHGTNDFNGEHKALNSWYFDAWSDYMLYTGAIKKKGRLYVFSINDGFSPSLLPFHSGLCENFKETQARIKKWVLESSKKHRRGALIEAYRPNSNHRHIFKMIDNVMTWVATDFNFGKTYHNHGETFGSYCYTFKGCLEVGKEDAFYFWKHETNGTASATGRINDERLMALIVEAISRYAPEGNQAMPVAGEATYDALIFQEGDAANRNDTIMALKI